ncbi:hypothetical protein RB195_007621 [Necator americanus]|uniref:Uncharacterized protein n=1 Tax=Necator americanus TaxID=51031 RepID=A0ABR1BZ94_NECAM
MDNASAYGAEDCRFESCRGRELFAPRLLVCQSPLVCHDIHPQSGRVAQWITRLPTEQKIAGSNPAVVENFSLHAFWSVNHRWSAMMSIHSRPRGAMDNASAYGAEDCRFESCRGRELFAPRLFVC